MNYNTGGYNPPPENGNQDFNNGFGGFPPQQNRLKEPAFIPHAIWINEKSYIRKLSTLAGVSILLYILFSSVYLAIYQGVYYMFNQTGGTVADNFNAFVSSAEFEYLFEILYSVFVVGGPFFILGAIFSKKRLMVNIPMEKPRKAKYLPLVILGAFGLCLAANFLASYIDIFFELLTGMDVEEAAMPETPRSVGGVLLFFLSTAVVPALVEEMALRGIVMQPLRRYGDWFAIICSSVIFALMHCNLAQIPFAFIAGIIIGYAVIVTDSLWTGVLIHFMNNAFSVAVTVVSDFYGVSSWQYSVCNVAFYSLIFIGAVCAYFAYKKYSDVKMKKSPLINKGKDFICQPHPYSAKISNKTFYGAYFLTIPMIAAIIYVCYETALVLLYT